MNTVLLIVVVAILSTIGSCQPTSHDSAIDESYPIENLFKRAGLMRPKFVGNLRKFYKPPINDGSETVMW